MIEIMGALGLVEWLGLASVSAVVLGAFRFRARPRRGDAAAAAAAPPPVVARQGGDGAGLPPTVSPADAHRARVQASTEAFQTGRGSVVLRIVHHLPYEYVDEFTAIEAIDALRGAGPDAPVDIILHTPGGLLHSAQQILHALKHHRGRKTAFIPYSAWSAGTMIALACDEIVLGSSAVIGPIDPQLGGLPAPLLAELLDDKSNDRINDQMLVIAKMAKQAVKEAKEFACDYVNPVHNGGNESCALTNELIGSGRNHQAPIMPQEARAMGLNVSMDMPELMYQICQPPPEEEAMLTVNLFGSRVDEKTASLLDLKSLEKLVR
ncbi:SDH family Clp fold serine proteinase [Maricaulis sp.]|uniref:SDH family Clp fold serine proteinase n=1 Tax=Maricaulis sp. TaxID=1486257 RepID=UPI003A924A7B|tara:strand:- start:884 stop:1849 length:966 start_codon:yes stop_codon:yes gene_type:complete